MSRAAALACALACMAAEAAAPARKPAPLAELKKDFAAGEFERVIKRADAALKTGLEKQDIAQVQLWRGQALLGLGREDAARAAFTSAVEASGEIELDAERASPDALRVFARARESVPATLSVTVAGGEATVHIDGKDFGPAPLVMQLSGGRHLVEARGTGALVAKSELELLPGRRREVQLTLAAPRPPPEPKSEPKPEPVVVAPAPAPAPVPAVQTQPAPPPARASRIGLVPLAGGVVLGAVGGVLLWQARVAYDSLNGDGAPLTAEQEAGALRNGPLLQSLGWAAVGVGAAATFVGVMMLVIFPDAPAHAGLFAVPGGGGVTVSATLR